MVVLDDAFEFLSEKLVAHAKLFSSVFKGRFELSDELVEGVVVKIAPVGLSLGNCSN